MSEKKSKEDLSKLMSWHFKQINLSSDNEVEEVHHQHFCSLSDEGNKEVVSRPVETERL